MGMAVWGFQDSQQLPREGRRATRDCSVVRARATEILAFFFSVLIVLMSAFFFFLVDMGVQHFFKGPGNLGSHLL